MNQSVIITDWIGKAVERTAVLDTQHAALVAATFGADAPQEGVALPSLWHWCWFNDALPGPELGRDGHPRKGGFLPPVELPRRMWAGGEIEFHAPIRIGEKITKRSTIEAIKEKNGSSGRLSIVTIRHQLSSPVGPCITEKQNLVYREDPSPDAPVPAPIAPPEGADVQRQIIPDPVLMFRYSAVTFNGHRIHYDADYAREVEGYPGIVFHAPLTATLLFDLATELAGPHPISQFSYRATAPLFADKPFGIKARKEGSTIVAWAETPSGGQAMLATANF